MEFNQINLHVSLFWKDPLANLLTLTIWNGRWAHEKVSQEQGCLITCDGILPNWFTCKGLTFFKGPPGLSRNVDYLTIVNGQMRKFLKERVFDKLWLNSARLTQSCHFFYLNKVWHLSCIVFSFFYCLKLALCSIDVFFCLFWHLYSC